MKLFAFPATPHLRAAVILAGSIGALTLAQSALATSSLWVAGTSGNWSTNASWTNGLVPNAIGDTATGANSLTNAATLDIPVTLGTLASGSVAWTINASGGNSFSMQNTAGTAAVIRDTQRALFTINPGIIIGSTDGLIISVSGDTSANQITITGGITGVGPLSLDTTATTQKAAGITINALNYTGALTVNGNATLPFGSATSVTNSAKVIIGPIAPSVTAITKNGVNLLRLTGATSGGFNGLATVNNGVLQLTNTNSVDVAAATFAVNSGAVLAVNAGGPGAEFTTANVDALLARTTFNAGSFLGIDTSNVATGLTYSSPVTGVVGLVKIGTNKLTLGANSSFTGKVVVQNGALSVSSLNRVSGGAATSNLGAPITVANGTIDLGTYNLDNNTNNNLAGGGTGVLLYTGLGETTDRVLNLVGNSVVDQSGTGSLKFTSNLTNANVGSAAKGLTLQGSTAGVGEISGNIGDSTGVNATKVTKNGTGTWILSGANTYTGTTAVTAGTLVARSATALSTGNVTVSAAGTLNYVAKTDTQLLLGGTLAVTGGGTPTTTLGGSIGSTATSAEINVTGNATINNAAHRVNVYGINGIAPLAGTNDYTLIHGNGVGSSLNPAAVPTLNRVFNNTNFTVGGFTRTATDLQVAITSATPVALAFWVGGLTGATNVWAASNGSTASNWTDTAGGAVQALVPGAGADVTISTTTPVTAPTATVLGADMTIKTLTIADTADGYGLTITPTVASAGITVNTGVPASSIGADVVLGASQTWTNDSTNALVVSGAVSGGSGNSLTKAGSGPLTLSGSNGYTGATNVSGGTVLVSGSLSGTASLALKSGTVQLGASNVINNAATVNLAGGKLDTGGFSEGDATAPGLGAFTLSVSSTLDFGTSAGSQLWFAGLGTHTAGAVLSILNWSGSAAGNGIDRLLFAGNTSDFTAVFPNQSDVLFNGVSGYAAIQFGSNYEIVAIPEPSSAALLGAATLLGLSAFRSRRKATVLSE